jgi:hypothetical protein
MGEKDTINPAHVIPGQQPSDVGRRINQQFVSGQREEDGVSTPHQPLTLLSGALAVIAIAVDGGDALGRAGAQELDPQDGTSTTMPS